MERIPPNCSLPQYNSSNTLIELDLLGIGKKEIVFPEGLQRFAERVESFQVPLQQSANRVDGFQVGLQQNAIAVDGWKVPLQYVARTKSHLKVPLQYLLQRHE